MDQQARTEELPNLQNILMSIASIGPDASRDSLIVTIDQSVEAIIEAVLAEDNPQSPAPDLLKSVEVALQFLEACSQTDDAAFCDHIATRAQELLAVMTSGQRSGPPELTREVRHEDFQGAFTDYFCDYIYRQFQEFHVEFDEAQSAYILRPAFAARFIKAVRIYVVPGMLASRRIRNMADSVHRNKLHQAYFFNEFSKSPEVNVFRIIWHSIMTDFQGELRTEISAKKARKFLKKKPPKKTATTVTDSHKKAHRFWNMLQAGAIAGEYDMPREGDFTIFTGLMDYTPDLVAENKVAIRQLLEQEMGIEDKEFERDGRQGATRDWLYKMSSSLPPHLGELLVLWGFHYYKDLFMPSIAKSFLAGQGTTEAARERAAPYFYRWFNPEDYQVGENIH